MRVGLVLYKSKSIQCKEDKSYIALESIAHALPDQKIYGITEALDHVFDYVIFLGKEEGLDWLIKNGHPKQWGKILHWQFLPHEMNDIPLLNKKLDADFDGFVRQHTSHWDIYNIFKKPLIECSTPYDFEHQKEHRKTKKKRKIALHILNTDDNYLNCMYTLDVFRRIEDVEGVARVWNPNNGFAEIAKRFGIDNRLDIITKRAGRRDYLESISDCKVILSMDWREMTGHTQLDAAAIGAYSICPTNPMQEMIFPEYIATRAKPAEIVAMVNDALERPQHKLTKNIMEKFNSDKIINKLYADLREAFE